MHAATVWTVRDGRLFAPTFYPGGHAEAMACIEIGRVAHPRHTPGRDTAHMPSENLDLVRSIYAAWERGDYSSVEWAHPEIEFVTADGPDPASSTGVAAMVEGWRDFLSLWQGYRFEAEEYRELDGERVLVVIDITARGKASGLELRQMGSKGATVLHVRHGKVVRIVLYWDRSRALTDLGLAPEAGSSDW